METTIDNNPSPPADAPRDTMEALAARLKAAEANPSLAKAHTTADGTVPSEAQKQPQTTPPAEEKTPPPAANKDGLQQFKDKDGNVDQTKIEKANEHLERGIKERDDLLKRNKDLLSKFTKTSQELAKTNKELQGQGANITMPEGGHGDNLDEVFLKRVSKLEENPLVLRDLIREEARALLAKENGEMRSVLDGLQRESLYATRAAELDELVKAGNTWIVTEGLGRFEKVFEEKPYLLQSQTPYMDALRFMDATSGAAPAPAQGGAPTPILGAGSAVPPPSSAPTATKKQKMAELGKQFREALQWSDRQGAAKIMDEMDRLEQGR